LASALLAPAIAALGQQIYDPEDTLARTRTRLLADTQNLPRYTCVQTVNRRYYNAASQPRKQSCAEIIAAYENREHELPLVGWDRLRFEVAIADGQNVYSWVGAEKFEEGAIERMAGQGPLSSGDFGPFLRGIFSAPIMHFEKEEVIAGRRLFLYSFQVPLDRSKYQFKGSQGWLTTAYSGTFLLDPQDRDIVHLTARTAELPDSTSSCQAISEIDYERTSIHDSAILIPSETRLRIIDRAGNESVNSTKYASCREFASQSRMLPDGPPNASAALVQQSSPLPSSLPAGLRFAGRLTTPFDSDTAAAGDPFEGTLRKTILDKDHQVLAPAGTRLHGRILRVQKHRGQIQIALRFETVELHGLNVPLRASPDTTLFAPNRYRDGIMFILREASSPDTTVISFDGEHLRLPQFDWSWTTLAPDNKK
jgi:hypothetical protein